jgi:thiol-disulfide isomerase/thioredoxin
VPEVKYRAGLLELRREITVWRGPANGVRSKWATAPKKPAAEAFFAEAPYERNNRTSARTYEDSLGGASLITQLQADEASLAAWKDRQLNPDDYEWEGPTCEDCGEQIVFDVTGSGTVTEWCPKCRWAEPGKIYEHRRGPVPGAFGEMPRLRTMRRFWSPSAHVAVKRRIHRAAPNRVFVLAPIVPTILGVARIHPSYAGLASKYSDIVSFALKGDPFVVPVPADMTPSVFQSRLSGHLRQNKRTHMGRWSVCRVKEGIRVGLIGSWQEPDHIAAGGAA